MKLYRHGDLLLREVKEIPKDAKLIEQSNERILAYGETTGHKHVLAVAEKISAPQISAYEVDGQTYLKIDKVSQLTHEEHKPLTIQPSVYMLVTEREYDYFKEEERQVVD